MELLEPYRLFLNASCFQGQGSELDTIQCYRK